MQDRIPAVVLAAGASTRMGRPKALLSAGGRTFIRRILETLRDAGIADAIVVVRPGDEAIAKEIAAAAFGRAIANPQPDRGQLTSLVAGLDAVDGDGVPAILVTLVDVPLISPSTVRTLCGRAPRSSAQIVRAVYHGRHGHPVIFKRPLFDALRRADPSVGAKAIVRSATIEDVDTGDPAVVEDVDTPEDYRRVVRPDDSAE